MGLAHPGWAGTRHAGLCRPGAAERAGCAKDTEDALHLGQTIGGHQATVGENFVAFTDPASKLHLIITAEPDGIPAAKELVARVQFVPDATNPAKWVPGLFR
jgi:hypothetical protein